MTRQGWLRPALAIGLVACGSDPSDPGGDPGFRVTAVAPADGATGVAWSATFEATLSAALDPASLTPDQVQLRREGALVPALIAYDPARRAIQIRAPLLPGTAYQAALGPGLRSADGDSLEEHTWIATTRAWEPASLAGLGELVNPALALGPSGSVHVFGEGEYRPYSDYFVRYMKYAECASNCGDPASWGRMAVDSAYHPHSDATVVVSPSGRVHLVHNGQEAGAGDLHLRYGTCASDCLDPGNWTLATLDKSRRLVALAQDGGGGLHLVTDVGGVGPEMEYSTCQADCADPANWAGTPIPTIGYAWNAARALRVDPGGGLHLITSYAGVMSYTGCPADCLSAARWSTFPVEGAESYTYGPALAVDGGGGVHLVFTPPSGLFTYARCLADCTDPSSWARIGLEQGGHVGGVLTVDGTGRITALDSDRSSLEIRFLSCLTDCLNAANWEMAAAGPLDLSDDVYPGSPRLGLGAGGRLHVVYSGAGGTLMYLE